MRKSYVTSNAVMGIVALAILVGAAVWLAPRFFSRPSVAVAAVPAVPVSVAPAARRDVPLYLSGLGNVQALNTVTVHTQVDGALQKVVFTEGQDVHVGDLLAQIDPRTYQAALDQAIAKKAEDEAQLANARLDLQRYTGLVDKNYVSRQQLDTTQSLVKQLEATVKADDAGIESARVTVGYTSIRSPIEARVGIRLVDSGNIVHASDPGGIVVLTQIHPISVLFTLPEDSVPSLVKAMAEGPVHVETLSRDDVHVLDSGTLLLIDNQIDQTTGMVKLKATMPNQDGLLWPGQFVNAKIRVGTLANVLTVPAIAVQHGPDGAYGYVVTKDGVADLRKLTVGETSEGLAVIKEGIVEGEQVVTAGHYRLQQGTRVATAASAPGGPAAPPAATSPTRRE